MAFLDIEKIINQEEIGSRFKLVHLAGLRAKELNAPTEETTASSVKGNQKVTSKALLDLADNKIIFEEKDEADLEEAIAEPATETEIKA